MCLKHIAKPVSVVKIPALRALLRLWRKLLSLRSSGAQRKQGCAKCILPAGFPGHLLELFIEAPQKVEGGGELSEVKKW